MCSRCFRCTRCLEHELEIQRMVYEGGAIFHEYVNGRKEEESQFTGNQKPSDSES